VFNNVSAINITVKDRNNYNILHKIQYNSPDAMIMKRVLHYAKSNLTFDEFQEFINATTGSGYTALYINMQYNGATYPMTNLHIALLLEYGANPNIKIPALQNKTMAHIVQPLDQSAYFRVDTLLRYGADFTLKDTNDKTPRDYLAGNHLCAELIDKSLAGKS
jgi:hypothetical protein